MEISVSSRMLSGNREIRENALPFFRSPSHSKDVDGTLLLPSEREGYGYETGDRILPYLSQDDYSRTLKDTVVKTVIMENDSIRAEFWPEFGMRLMSLYRKKEGKELLFSNSVLRIADLAIRRAWFSGGIEWNIGQLGHTFTTCDDLFVSVMDGGDGKFLRCFEYERCKGLYWSVDFHLEDGDDFISAYVRIVNRKDVPVPFYWWTNAAVPEVPGVRIFSGVPDIIYIHPSSLSADASAKAMAHGTLPFLPDIREGADFSYPESFTDYSNEYFFQNGARLDETWEAASYPDGWVFFDRSSERLRYRKMFCWGGLAGGRHWRDYLSLPGKGDYIELQAGFARTQMHGMDMPARTEWDFVQFFGGMKASPSTGEGRWEEARDRILSLVEEAVPSSLVRSRLGKYRGYSTLQPSGFIHLGSGYGALEEAREKGITPDGFLFPSSSIGVKEEPWLLLLRKGVINEIPADELPSSYIVDKRWEPYLRKASSLNYTAMNLLGVLYAENEETAEAEKAFSDALGMKENPFSHRCLAILMLRAGREAEAVEHMGRCCAMAERREYAEEYISMLSALGLDEKAWEYFSALSDAVKNNERVMQAALPSALKLRKLDMLSVIYSREPSTVREGNRVFSDGYYVYRAIEDSVRNGIPFTEELVRKHQREDTVPYFADFRQG